MDSVYLILLYIVLIWIMDRRLRADGWKGPVSDHFDGQRFKNIGGDKMNQKKWLVFKWLAQRKRSKWVFRLNAHKTIPQGRVEGSELVVTMVNHATVLIQTMGQNILLDPVWSKRVSPFTWLGPKRYRPPGVAFSDLPPIDAVIISHNHYDHMDVRTLKRLAKRWHPIVIAGLGNAEYLVHHGIQSVDVDWWGRYALEDGVSIVAVPGQHFSSRAFSDRDKTLWCGFVIETPHGHIYFAGDTGYGPFLQEIKDKYTGFRLALLPIGAYLPHFFMSPVHMSPSEAYRVAHELHAHTMVPVHYGTFHLADDAQDQPIADLKSAMTSDQKGHADVVILDNGESVQIPIQVT